MSAETMVLVLQRLNEIFTKITNIEEYLDNCPPSINAQRAKRRIRHNYASELSVQVMDEIKPCQVLQVNQIMLEIHQNEYKWMNRRLIMTSLSQLVTCHYQKVDLKNFHFLPSIRNITHLFMTFRMPALPSRLMEMKNILWRSHLLYLIRVFKDETVRQPVPGREPKQTPIRNNTCTKEEDKPVSLELEELEELKRRLLSIKSIKSQLSIKSQFKT